MCRQRPITPLMAGSPVNLVLGNGDKGLKQSRLQDFSVSLIEACKAPDEKHLQTPSTKFTGEPPKTLALSDASA